MAKASDNLYPYLHLVPGATPAAPAAGAIRVFSDSGDSNKVKRINSAGTVTTIEGGGVSGGDTSWTAPTLNTGWTNLGGGWAPVGYRKDALGFVHLRGAITNSAAGGTAFTLPAGYRPAAAGQLGWLPLGGSTGQQVRVTPTGDVIRDSGTGYVMLDVISFLAEQ